jgi:hypothetical protein
MKLEQQVCSLELARKLKKLGVEQDSIFFWCKFLGSPDYDLISGENEPNEYDDLISAFTVAELGEMLPKKIRENEYLRIIKNGKNWEVAYGFFDWDGFEDTCKRTDFTEADARAKMLIYLLENKLLKVA